MVAYTQIYNLSKYLRYRKPFDMLLSGILIYFLHFYLMTCILLSENDSKILKMRVFNIVFRMDSGSIEAKYLDVLKNHRSFLYIFPEDDLNAYWMNIMLKCFYAAFGTCYVFHPCATYTTILLLYIIALLYNDPWRFPLMAFNTTLLATYGYGIWQFGLAVAFWFLSSVIADFHFVLDAYILVMSVEYLTKYLNLNVCTFVPLVLTVNWWIDNYLGKLPLNLLEAFYVLFIVVSLFYFVRPSRSYFSKKYLRACITLIIVLALKFFRIWFTRGLHGNPFSFPYERYQRSFNMAYYFFFKANDSAQSIIIRHIILSIFLPEERSHPLIDQLFGNLTSERIMPMMKALPM